MSYGKRPSPWSSFVHYGPSCWEWMGAISNTGYGSYAINRKPHSAHRVAYEARYGSIPNGMYVLHRCDNRKCVRPDHLFLGTNSDNMLDKCNKGRHHNQVKTHCPRGHEYSEVNTYLTPSGGKRMCRTCMKGGRK